MKHEKFEEDLARGMVAEDLAFKLVKGAYKCAAKINAFKGYDIWVPELHHGIEVKADLMSQQTGKFFIEVEFDGKPSGLDATTAGYWLLWDAKQFLLITPESIRQLIHDLKLEKKQYLPNDATKARKAYLVPKQELFEKSEKVWEKIDVPTL